MEHPSRQTRRDTGAPSRGCRDDRRAIGGFNLLIETPRLPVETTLVETSGPLPSTEPMRPTPFTWQWPLVPRRADFLVERVASPTGFGSERHPAAIGTHSPAG